MKKSSKTYFSHIQKSALICWKVSEDREGGRICVYPEEEQKYHSQEDFVHVHNTVKDLCKESW